MCRKFLLRPLFTPKRQYKDFTCTILFMKLSGWMIYIRDGGVTLAHVQFLCSIASKFLLVQWHSFGSSE